MNYYFELGLIIHNHTTLSETTKLLPPPTEGGYVFGAV